MNTQSVIQSAIQVQPCASQILRDHHLDLRNQAIGKYRKATFWTTRRAARSDALHHAKLVRMLEGRS